MVEGPVVEAPDVAWLFASSSIVTCREITLVPDPGEPGPAATIGICDWAFCSCPRPHPSSRGNAVYTDPSFIHSRYYTTHNYINNSFLWFTPTKSVSVYSQPDCEQWLSRSSATINRQKWTDCTQPPARFWPKCWPAVEWTLVHSFKRP